jgi:hypothetical protein
MKLSEIQEEWKKDSQISEVDLGRESLKTPQLHSKYLTFLSNAKLRLRKEESKYFNTRRLKYKYYRGEMARDELEELGWSQFQGNKPLKNEMDEYLQCDEDLITCMDNIEYLKTSIYTLEQIIRSINSRTWDIKSAIEYVKFTNGSF